MQPLHCEMWAIEPNAFRQFLTLAEAGINMDSEAVRITRESRREKTIAILPVHGVLEARPSWMGAFLGMSNYETIGLQMDMLMNDESVKGVVLDVMSPGGMVYGVSELANKIYSYRGVKPIVAVANPMAASGAYWIAAAADRLISTPSADVGSVGVIWQHVDISKAHEKKGVKITTIRSTGSPYKAESMADESLSDSARETMQARADEIYADFVSDLAKFRGVSVEHVKEQFGKGRVVNAKKAKSAKMIDQTGTLQDVVNRLAAGKIRIASGSAEEEQQCSPTVRELRMERLSALKELTEDSSTN